MMHLLPLSNACLRLLITLAALIAASPPMSPPARAESVTLEKSVVMIRSVKQGYDYVTPWKQLSMMHGVGSGFIIANNMVLTNAHNVSDSRYLEIKKQNFAKRYPARVMFIGHDCDLALLTVAEADFFDDTEPLQLGGIPPVNSTVSTYGFPVGGEHVSVTEGVVSRVQMDAYSHSGADSHLVVQTDAAINPGNSGGPVVQKGKVVGVAFQGLRAADNIGYMIPTTVIRHFLADIEDGKYDGFGSLGFAFYPGLHSESYRDYLKVPANEQGIVVLRTVMHSSVEGVLQRGDVITSIDGYDIDNDGMTRVHGLRLHMAEVIEGKQIGESVKVSFYRDGSVQEIDAQVALNRTVVEYARLYDTPPDYVVVAGLTFVPMTRNFLETWGSGWSTKMPFYLRYLFQLAGQLNTDRQRRQYVVLSEIMPDEVNAHAAEFKNLPIDTISGMPIRTLSDVADAWKAANSGQDGFCTLKFMGKDRPLIIDSQKAQARHGEILEKYKINPEARWAAFAAFE